MKDLKNYLLFVFWSLMLVGFLLFVGVLVVLGVVALFPGTM
jgi:hypothetical protein